MTSFTRNGQHPEGLPPLCIYAKAKVYHDKVAPYRSGHRKGERPLGEVRRYTRSLIRECEGDIILSYYDHDVIRFTPDNKIHLSHCGWPSLSTLQFLQNILGGVYSFTRKKGKIYLNMKNGHYLLGASPSSIIIDANIDTAVGGESLNTFTLNKPKLAELRNVFRPFIDYAHKCLIMTSKFPTPKSKAAGLYVKRSDLGFHKYARQSRGEPTQAAIRQKVLQEILDAQKEADEDAKLGREGYGLMKMYAQFELVCSNAGYHRHYGGANSMCSRHDFDEFFTALLKLHYAQELFVETIFASPIQKIPRLDNLFFVECSVM